MGNALGVGQNIPFVTCFPNPTKGLVEIRGLTSDVKIDIYNFEGKYIKSFDQVFIDLNTNQMEYIIKLVSGNLTTEFVTLKNKQIKFIFNKINAISQVILFFFTKKLYLIDVNHGKNQIPFSVMSM